jgi:hypothetical protein
MTAALELPLSLPTADTSKDVRRGHVADREEAARVYVRAHLAQMCIELQSRERESVGVPKLGSCCAKAAELLREGWSDFGELTDLTVAHMVETCVRDECVAHVAANAVPSGASWRAKLLQLNLWLQLIGASMGLLGQHFINERNAAGFVCWIISNCALITLQRRAKMPVLTLLYCVYLLMSFQGLWLWMAR